MKRLLFTSLVSALLLIFSLSSMAQDSDPLPSWNESASKQSILDKGLDEALQKGWTVVDMKKDWKVEPLAKLRSDL